MFRTVATAIALLLLSGGARADGSELIRGPLQSGNDYLRYCQAGEDDAAFVICVYYTKGVVDGWSSRDRLSDAGIPTRQLICLPESVTMGQIVAMTIRYMELKPEYRSLLAREVVTLTMMEHFMCP